MWLWPSIGSSKHGSCSSCYVWKYVCMNRCVCVCVCGLPKSGMASDTWGSVSATKLRNTVSESKMVTPVQSVWWRSSINESSEKRKEKTATSKKNKKQRRSGPRGKGEEKGGNRQQQEKEIVSKQSIAMFDFFKKNFFVFVHSGTNPVRAPWGMADHQSVNGFFMIEFFFFKEILRSQRFCWVFLFCFVFCARVSSFFLVNVT